MHWINRGSGRPAGQRTASQAGLFDMDGMRCEIIERDGTNSIIPKEKQ